MSRARLAVITVFIVLIGLFSASPLWAGGLKPAASPTVTTTFTASSNAQGVMLMDVDGDGIMDLVVVEPTITPTCAASNNPSQVEVFLGNGSGGFGAATAVTIVCEGGGSNKKPVSVALAHGQLLGGAAHPDDIVVANSATNDIIVLANTSTSGVVNLAYTTNSPIALAGGADPEGLAVADVDGDTNQDIIVADKANNQLEILLGNSGTAATFSVTTATVPLAGAGPVAVVVGNFGSLHTGTTSAVDIATANNSNGTVSILTNTTTATGTPTFAVAPKTVGTNPVAIAAGVNLGTTGAVDLAVANQGSSNVSVLINNGGNSGTFANAANVGVGSPPSGVGIADFNADTNNDIVVADASGGAGILFNNCAACGGVGTFGGLVHFPAGTTPAGMAIGVPPSQFGPGDINGDNFPDVAVADTGANTVSILLGTPFFNIQKPAIPNQVEGVSSGPISLLTFQYDLSTPTFAADITNWGDGQSTLGITPTFNAGTGTYTVTGTHTYAEQNAAGETIQITVTDSSVSPNPTLTTTASIAAVDDGALTASNPPDLPSAGTVPHTYSSVLVANFTDQNKSAPITDFSSTIDWDDCGPSGNAPGTTVGTCATIPANLDTTGVVGGSGGSYTITGTHTYNKAGFFTITTVITDAEGGGVQKTVPGAVTHANLSTLTVTPVAVAGTEGAQLTNPTVLANLTTTDPSPNLSAQADFNCATAPSGCVLSSTNISVVANGVSGCASQFCVITTGTTHTYADEGSFNIFVSVSDAGDGSTGTTTSVATIGDAPLNQIATPALSHQEGAGTFTNVIVGQFHDANTGAPAADFTATINWGDGNSDVGCNSSGGNPNCSIASLGGGDFKIVGTHPYANAEETNTYQIRYSVQDVGTSQITLPAACPATPTEGCGAAISFTDAALSDVGAAPLVNQEGTGTFGSPGPQVTVAVFHDAFTSAPAADFTARIDWGDGTMDTGCNSTGGNANCSIVSMGGGNFAVTGMHTYLASEETNGYQIHYSVQDVGSPNPGDPGRVGNPELAAPTAVGAAVSFTDAPLAEVPGIVASGAQGALLNPAVPIAAFTDGYALAPLSDFAPNVIPPAVPTLGVVSINWGDGSPTQTNGGATNVGTIVALGTSGCTFQFCVLPTGTTHKYPNNPSPNPVDYPITVVVKDVGGSTATIHGTAHIAAEVLANLPLPGQPISTSNIIPNASLPFVGSFSDNNPNATPNFFTATIDWGDGQPTTNGTISFICGNGAGSPGPCLAGDSEFNIAGSHTYLTLGVFTVTITVTGGTGLQGPCPACIQTQLNVNSIGAQPFTAQISPQQSQVHVGSSVDLLLTLAPNIAGGWPGSVQLGCSGLGTGMNCTFLPSSNVPDVLQTRQIHVIVSTTTSVAQSTPPPLPGSNGPVQLALLLPAFFGTFGLVLMAPRARKNRRRTILWWAAGLLLLALLLVGCGGGAPVNLGPPANVTPPGAYNVTITINTPGVTQPVATIQVVK